MPDLVFLDLLHGPLQLLVVEDLHQQVASINSEENFIQGFRLGVQLMAECLTELQGGEG